TKIIEVLERQGIAKEDIETQNYSVQAQYDYKEGTQSLAGYDANQRLIVKVRDIQSDVKKTGQVIAAASEAGSNQMHGVTFEVSSISDLKQQAKIMAIEDAKRKSGALASAAEVKLGKVVGWYENDLSNPDNPVPYGMGGAVMEKSLSSVPAQIPSGTEDIVVEVSLTYDVK
ncbi:MAG: Outer membrane protein, 28kDa, partial [uncultured bacterium]